MSEGPAAAERDGLLGDRGPRRGKCVPLQVADAVSSLRKGPHVGSGFIGDGQQSRHLAGAHHDLEPQRTAAPTGHERLAHCGRIEAFQPLKRRDAQVSGQRLEAGHLPGRGGGRAVGADGEHPRGDIERRSPGVGAVDQGHEARGQPAVGQRRQQAFGRRGVREPGQQGRRRRWTGGEAERGGGDDAEAAVAADEELRGVVAGDVLHHARAAVDEGAVGLDGLDPQDPIARGARREPQRPRDGGRQEAANGCAAGGLRLEQQRLSEGREKGFSRGQRRAGL
ncbi:hypothetical protein D3C72_778630 [compost metagenome]